MGAHAIVIGIDGYPDPAWNLAGAARDAIAFARWATTDGGVALKDLTLHLSVRADDLAVLESLQGGPGRPDLISCRKDATREAIRDTFYNYYNEKAAEGADRLWFYYAGHGLAPPGGGPSAGPIIVPADVTNLKAYVDDSPLALELWRSRMEDAPPREQFFFVDACRDVVPAPGNKSLRQDLIWDVREVEGERLATQVVFLATTAGKSAKEIRGRGVFGRALLAGLRGMGPRLSPPAEGATGEQAKRERLLFLNVAKFVQEVINDELVSEFGAKAVQVVDPQIIRPRDEVEIARFSPRQVPTVRVGAIIEPEAARRQGRIEFQYWNDDEKDWLPRGNPPPRDPPLPNTTEFTVRCGTHRIRVTSVGFREKIEDHLFFEEKRFEINLEPDAGLESVPVGTGEVALTCRDRLAQMTLLDGAGRALTAGYGSVQVSDLKPGPYVARAELAGVGRVERTIEVRAGEMARVTLDAASPAPAQELARHLAGKGFLDDEGHFHPSENFGVVEGATLGSVLAYAAWASRWPEDAGFYHLRRLGVDPLPGLGTDQNAVQVLIGDAMADGEPDFLERCRVTLDVGAADLAVARAQVVILGNGADATPQALPLLQLAEFPVALQGSALATRSGPIRVRVEMPGFATATFALALLSGFVTTLIVSREEREEVHVQQYLNPIDPTRSVAPGLDPPLRDDVRLVELAWRALEARDPLSDLEFRGLLEGKRSNPLLAVIAGYRMCGTAREDQFRGPATPPPDDGFAGPSALWNLVRLFPALPDVHVLAGLYDPARRDEHFRRAMEVGTPVLAEGFWTLVRWLTEQAAREQAPPPVLRQSLASGTVWTAFTDVPRAARVNGMRVVLPTGQAYQDMDWEAKALSVARSVGRVEFADRQAAFICSCFLLTAQVAVCPAHFAEKFAKRHADGSWSLTEDGALVRFDPSPRSTRWSRVAHVLGRVRPDIDHPNGGTLPPALLEQCWPVLLLLDQVIDVTPPLLASAPVQVGQRVAVVGFPRSDARVPGHQFAALFDGAAGEKHVMTGAILRAPDASWTLDYDCFTADGTSGGCVVDLATGAVVGMHVAGFYPPGGRKRAVGIAWSRLAFHPALLDVGARFDAAPA